MAKIREDLAGVVSVDGYNLSAGDEVPEGVSVGDHVLAQVAKDEPVERPAPKRRSRKSDSEEE